MDSFQTIWDAIDHGDFREVEGAKRSASQQLIATVDELVADRQITTEQRYQLFRHFWERIELQKQSAHKAP